MKSFVSTMLVLGGLAAAVEVAAAAAFDYHADIGIPQAARIRAAEESENYDGYSIIGGKNSTLGQFPYFVGLDITLKNVPLPFKNSSGAGVLLSPTRALTSSQCWYSFGIQAEYFIVVLGSTRLYSGGTRFKTSDVITHPNNATSFNDVAIIRFPAVTFNDNIRSIPFATGTDQFVGSVGVFTAFVDRDFDTQAYVSVKVISNTECGKGTTPEQLCALSLVNCGPQCLDQGGPLVVNNQLVGTLSECSEECNKTLPVVFMRTSFFAPWIQSLM